MNQQRQPLEAQIVIPQSQNMPLSQDKREPLRMPPPPSPEVFIQQNKPSSSQKPTQ